MKQLSLLSLVLICSLGLSAQTDEPDLNLDLIGHYLLDGSDADFSGHGNHAMAFGSYTSDRNGQADAALRLSEDGHHILFPPVIALSEPEWTYSLWVMPERLASEVSDMFLLSLSDVEVWDDIHLFIDDTGDEFKTWFASDYDKRSTGVKAEVGEWYHVAISSAADDTVRIYVNGQKKLSHYIDFISEGSESFMLSSLIDLPDTPLKGRFFGVVDDIRIYSRAIADAEVATLHDPLWDFVPEPFVPEFMHILTSTLMNTQPLRLYTNAFIERFSMYDVQGREVMRTFPLASEDITIFTPALAAGMYILHAHTPSTLFRGKVMVLR